MLFHSTSSTLKWLTCIIQTLLYLKRHCAAFDLQASWRNPRVIQGNISKIHIYEGGEHSDCFITFLLVCPLWLQFANSVLHVWNKSPHKDAHWLSAAKPRGEQRLWFKYQISSRGDSTHLNQQATEVRKYILSCTWIIKQQNSSPMIMCDKDK